ncbi:MAG TPA: transporter substrate-binding domain-containing protein, partial [Lachnospiraceae bacterium]|nr:transporter substrate-binding domain-containing protein [Lachnospiraceae bacterium]
MAKRERLFLFISSIMILVSFFTAFTASAVHAGEQQKTVRIGYIDYEGFITKEENGTYSGYGVECLDTISDYTGWNYEYVYDSLENQIENLKTGKIDFFCHAQKTNEREKDFLFSKYSIGSESGVLYVRSDDTRYFYNDFPNFNNMKIAFIKNSFHNEEFADYAQNKGFQYTSVEFDTQSECFAALKNKTVDAVAKGSLALNPDFSVVCRYGAYPFYIITNKSSRSLLDDLDDALGQIMAINPSFTSSLYDQYYGTINHSQEIIFTREEASFINTTPEVTVCFLPDRAPFSYIDENGTPAGIMIDIVKLIEERSGLHFLLEMKPDGIRSLDYMEEHPNALIAGIWEDAPEFQANTYLLSDVIYSDEIALACRSGYSYNFSAPDTTYKLAIPNCFNAFKSSISKDYPEFKIVECSSDLDCAKEVLSGNADFMAQNVNVITSLLSDPHYEGLTVLPTFFMDEDFGIVCKTNTDNKLLMSIFNKCIISITDKELSQFT